MSTTRRAWANDRLLDLLSMENPIVQRPFGGGRSSIRLVTAVAEVGGLGSVSGKLMPRSRVAFDNFAGSLVGRL